MTPAKAVDVGSIDSLDRITRMNLCMMLSQDPETDPIVRWYADRAAAILAGHEAAGVDLDADADLAEAVRALRRQRTRS